MESKYYYFPGQNPNNTKISDRAHALHITKTAWNGITQHLDRKKRIQEALEKEEAHKRALKEGSQAMTKEWKDSIENIRLTKEEERKERLHGTKKDDKIQLFYKMRKEQEALRNEYIEKMKKKTFLTSGYPKQLTSALILSETLYERDRQREFEKQIKKREKEIEKTQIEMILENDKKGKEEMEEKKKERLEYEKQVANTLLDQINERSAAHSKEIKSHIERETRDRIKAAEEEELIKKHEEEEKQRKIKESLLERRHELEMDRQRQKQLKKEEEEFEKAVHFYSNAKHRIECMKKQKEKEMREEAIALHEKLAQKVAQEQEDKSAVENERIAKAVAEKEEAEKVRQQARKDIQEKGKQMRIEGRKQFLQKLEDEKKIEEEMKRWELLNRIKTAETMQEYNEQNRKKKWADILQYRKDLIEQMAEQRQIMEDEKEMDRLLSQVSFEETDRMFFNYANEVMEYAKNKNRTTYPIEKVIEEYKKANRFDLMKKVPRRCKHYSPLYNS